MAKTINSLWRISTVIRNLGTLNNCTIIKRFIQSSSSCSINYNKDTLVSPQPHLVNQKAQDLSQTSLQYALRNSHKLTEIFDIIQNNSTKMSVLDAVVALENLFNVDKVRGDKTSKIYMRPEFLTLCEIIQTNIRKLSVRELITVLKSMIYFDVPTTSIIVQIVLQMLRHSVNHLSLQQIEFIEFLLVKCEKTPLVEALMIALPIVYESNLMLKLDRESIQSITSALKFLSRKSENKDVFAVLLNAIRNFEEPIDPLLAKSILWSLCNLRFVPDGLPDIIDSVQNILAQNITSLDWQAVKQLISHVSDKVSSGERYFYHEGFADACATAVVSEDWGFTDAVYILDKLFRMGHTQISLLDYIATKCFEDPTILKSCPSITLATIVAGFSSANYKPVFWEVIQEAVMSTRVLEDHHLNYPLSKLAVHLISLDCYCPKILEKVFGHSLELSKLNRREKGRILFLYQAVKTLYPQYTGPWPTVDIVKIFSPSFKNTDDDFPLLQSLEYALGGRPYVLTNVRSKLGHIIDHVVVLRNGGYPIAINNDANTDTNEYPMISMDELRLPEDGQVILILHMIPHAYSTNSQRMKGIWSMYIKSLEALSSYTVIPIQSTMWARLPGSERIPYLTQAIKLKCNDISIAENSCK